MLIKTNHREQIWVLEDGPCLMGPAIAEVLGISHIWCQSGRSYPVRCVISARVGNSLTGNLIVKASEFYSDPNREPEVCLKLALEKICRLRRLLR